MANLTINQLGAAGTVSGGNLLPIWQGALTYKATASAVVAPFLASLKGTIISGAPALDTYSGTVVSVTVTSNSVGYGAILTLSGGGNFVMANATSSTAIPCLAMALETGTGTKKVLLNGFVSKTGWTWNKGPVYVNTTNGLMTQTIPSATGNIVQVVGYAFTATKIYFNPDLTTIEVA